jgi:glycosyltransferase involved in cell wall biosynthesis
MVDDASGDGTLGTLKALAAEYPPGWVRVISLDRNAGPGGARNAGWDQATQPWIAFLDADDAWHPRKIELQLSWLKAHPHAVLCGHGTTVAPSENAFPTIPPTVDGWRVTFVHMLISNRFPTRSVMLRRDLPFRFGGKDVTEDYLLWLEIVLCGHPSYRIEAPLAVSFRVDSSPGGYSGQLWRHEKRELAAWQALRRKSAVSAGTWFLASTWSLIKYVRRALR